MGCKACTEPQCLYKGDLYLFLNKLAWKWFGKTETCSQNYVLLIIYRCCVNLLKPTGYVMHHQFNIRQLYALPTLYLCILYLSENKQRLVPLTA